MEPSHGMPGRMEAMELRFMNKRLAIEVFVLRVRERGAVDESFCQAEARGGDCFANGG